MPLGGVIVAAVGVRCLRMILGASGHTIGFPNTFVTISGMGLAVASVFGHDCVVFLDDDEVALDEDYLVRAVYGLDTLTRQNLRILAKTGFYINYADSPYADMDAFGVLQIA